MTITETTFTGSGTWTKAAGTINMIVIGYNAGSGGGSGRQGLTTAAGGGGGACSAGTFYYSGPAILFNGTETVTIGSIGTGGAAQTLATNDGINGNPGGLTSFGNLAVSPDASNIGPGGINGSTTAARDVSSKNWNQSTIKSTSITANTGGQGTKTVGSPGTDIFQSTGLPGSAGGGGGGGDSATARTGGIGGNYDSLDGNTIIAAGGTAGIEGGTVAGGIGANGKITAGLVYGGLGGGGGGGMKAVGPGAGGNGGIPGGGGGGGGGSINGTNSGAGGNGGAGRVYVYEFNY